MSRMLKLTAVLAMALMLLFTISCEGPMGPAGTDGVDGVDGVDGQDGQVTCLSCHNAATMADNQFEFSRSIHGLGINVDYAGGRASCAQCHSGNGFVEWATTGSVAGNIAIPTAWECNTCHGLHSTFEEADYALRMTDAVVGLFDGATSIDFGASSNLCVNCHQSRSSTANYWNGTDANATLTSSHAGPHHGPQANLLAGNNGSHIGTVDKNIPMAHANVGCVGCHMKEAAVDTEGGHTFWPTVESCSQAGCHTSATSFDVFGSQTAVSEKLEELAGLLVTAGILDSTHSLIPGTYTSDVFQAWWNWDLVEEDRSLGVHNPPYAKQLLDNSIAALGN